MSFKKSFTRFTLSSLVLSTFIFAVESNVVIISLDDITIPIVLNQTVPTPGLDPVKQGYLDAINQARSQTQDCGVYGIKPAVSALTWNENLYTAAAMQSNDMAESGNFSHIGSGEATDIVAQQNHPGVGSTVQERIEYTGYTWSWSGENIAAGQNTVAEVMIDWLNSDGHCANIMNPNFKDVGMALETKEGSAYYYYWTQNFATPR